MLTITERISKQHNQERDARSAALDTVYNTVTQACLDTISRRESSDDLRAMARDLLAIVRRIKRGDAVTAQEHGRIARAYSAIMQNEGQR